MNELLPFPLDGALDVSSGHEAVVNHDALASAPLPEGFPGFAEIRSRLRRGEPNPDALRAARERVEFALEMLDTARQRLRDLLGDHADAP